MTDRENDWWDPDDELFAMSALLDGMRFPYFMRVLAQTLHNGPAELTVLDVGCGGGSLSLLFSRAGCDVSGVDVDGAAIECARQQGTAKGFSARFDVASAEALPFAAASFDVVICSEVLEHVDDFEAALSEIYRVLKFGGIFLFSAPNRTVLSYLLLIKIAQDWRLTRVITRIEHRFDKLINANQLLRRLDERGIDVYDIQGVSIPVRAIPDAIHAYFRFKTNRGSLASLASSLQLCVGKTMSLAYIGWGVKFG
ncbi:bifunctional 2-polyprenyl-6-hydroxyphenol methylase/3-demethylubiquinol 3-O-methyltransferase UbiG [soil metagenome]